MTDTLLLPGPAGTLERYTLGGATRAVPARHAPSRTRRVFAAAHVVIDPLSTADPTQSPVIDWESTLAFRHHVWDHGFGVAEAMDTAQRGMGLPPSQVRELIERSCREAVARQASIACGAATDTIPDDRSVTLADIERAYLEQCEWIESAGGQVIVMASRALCRTARSADDYHAVYDQVLGSLQRPAVLHWLGDMFDPQLSGYWGGADLDAATEIVLELINRNASKIDGIKISLLDADREIAFRRRLPEGTRLYTGDDFNYPTLIKGDDQGYSDALLGIFDAIAPLAAEALSRLDDGDLSTYDEILKPTVALSRAIFEAPTYHYKTGVVFLAYLRGMQSHFTMLAGAQSSRSITHLSTLLRLADASGLIEDTDLAVARMLPVLEQSGIDGRA